MRIIRPALVAVAVMAVVGSCASTSAQATTIASARLTTARPFPGESVAITGHASSGSARVILQRSVSGSWKSVSATHTGKSGAYAFHVRASRTATSYRVHVADNGSTHNSHRVVVKAVAPKASMSVLAAPVGQTTTKVGLYPVTAAFSPARQGVKVVVQRLSGSSWVTATTGSEDSSGHYSGLVSAATGQTFRVVAKPGKGASNVVSATQRPAAKTLVFDEGFGGSKLDATATPSGAAAWTLRSVAGVGRTCATSKLSQIKVKSGIATLSVSRQRKPGSSTVWNKKSGCKYGTYNNAALQSNQTFKYGVFSARIKFQSGAGQHGSMFVQGAGDPKHSAEIDTVEYFGDGRKDFGISSGIYSSAGKSGGHVGGLQTAAARKILKGKAASKAYHTYSVSWTKSGYTFYIDGKQTFKTKKPYVASAAEHIVIDLATSNYELKYLARDKKGKVVASKSAMKIDWVRVYQ